MSKEYARICAVQEHVNFSFLLPTLKPYREHIDFELSAHPPMRPGVRLRYRYHKTLYMNVSLKLLTRNFVRIISNKAGKIANIWNKSAWNILSAIPRTLYKKIPTVQFSNCCSSNIKDRIDAKKMHERFIRHYLLISGAAKRNNRHYWYIKKKHTLYRASVFHALSV